MEEIEYQVYTSEVPIDNAIKLPTFVGYPLIDFEKSLGQKTGGAFRERILHWIETGQTFEDWLQKRKESFIIRK